MALYLRKVSLLSKSIKLKPMMSRFLVVASFALMTHPAFAVYEIVEIQLPASRLAGSVHDPSGSPIEGVNVTLHRCAVRSDGSMDMNEKVIGTAMTDATGHFALPRNLRPSSACLSFRLIGFNPVLAGIKWRSSAPALEVKMPIGG